MPTETAPHQEQSHMLTEEQRQQVARLAYESWQASGQPEGMREDGSSWSDFFWVNAERTVLGTGDGDSGAV
jgi:hypothetical protein